MIFHIAYVGLAKANNKREYSDNIFFQDEGRFLEDFKAAYEMMMEKGNQDLTIPV